MSEVKYQRLYTVGNYDACVQEIQDLLKEINNGRDINKLISASRLDSCARKMEHHILSVILEGNVIVTKYVIQFLTAKEIPEYFGSSMNYFYLKINTLVSSSETFPLSIYLNSIYNSLWLLWIKGKFEDRDKDEVLDIFENGFERVLLAKKIQINKLSDENKSEKVLLLLQLVISNISTFEAIESLQIVEISMLCLLLLQDFKTPLSKNYKSSIYGLRNSWPLVEAKYLKLGNEIDKSKTKLLKLFKFGLFKVNEVPDYDTKNVYESLCIISCLLVYKLGFLQESADILTSHVSESCCWSLCSYTLAFIFAQLQEWNVVKIYIDKACNFHMNEYAQAEFHILQGQLCSSNGYTSSAHIQFENLLTSKHFINAGVHLILNNLTSSVHSFCNCEDNISSNALIEKFIQIVWCFYTFITNTSLPEETRKYDPGEKILSILKKGRSYKKEDIFHAIGKEMLWIEVLHLSTDISYNAASIASKCYMDILCSYFRRDQSLQTLHLNSNITHEAVVALILSDKIDDAEVVCQILIPKCTKLEKYEEVVLNCQEVLCMKSGVVALILIALIKIHKKKFEEAQDFLTRTKKLMVQIFYCGKSGHKNDLVDAVFAKVYILKAILFSKTGFKVDAFKCCQKAVIHDSGDGTVQEILKIAQKIGAEISFPKDKKQYSVRQCKSVTIQFLLSANVSF